MYILHVGMAAAVVSLIAFPVFLLTGLDAWLNTFGYSFEVAGVCIILEMIVDKIRRVFFKK